MKEFIEVNYDNTYIFEDGEFKLAKKNQQFGNKTFLHIYSGNIVCLSINSVVFAINLKESNKADVFITHYYDNGELNIDIELNCGLEASATNFINSRMDEDPLTLFGELANRLIPICNHFLNANIE